MRYLWLVLFFQVLRGVIGPDFFKLYPNYYFVETGTAGGASVDQALKAGFVEIHSIEIVPSDALRVRQKFLANKNVHIWLGDSSIMLKKVITALDKPITFWLDAHSQGELQSDHLDSAILSELDQIKQHPIKTHTLLIDDMRLFGTFWYSYITIEQVIKKIKEINPNYTITFIDGTTKNDVLVAQVLKT